jgi:hypothetical protein
VRDLIASAARLPLWARWAVVFFLIFTTAAYFRGNLMENPLYTIGVCILIGIAFGVLAQIEQKLPGGRKKREP